MIRYNQDDSTKMSRQRSEKRVLPRLKLSWKFAIFTGLLVILVTVAITYPIFWQTRQALENQLTVQLQQNVQLIRTQIDPTLVNLLAGYPELTFIRDSLKIELNQQAALFSAQAIYIIAPSGRLLVVSGNEESALKSALLHSIEIASAVNGQIVSSPLFADRFGNYYKSVFAAIALNNGKSAVLGLDASAGFLEITAKLRNQILTLSTVILIISIGLVLLLARTMTKPIENLTDYARAIGQGRSDLPVLPHRYDEIGFLGQTMLKMHSELSQRDKENKQLLASVAHEIRNPLGGMKINAELLLEEASNSVSATKYTTAIVREVDRLSQIVESFLAYARPIETNLATCDLNELIREVIRDLKPDFPSAEIIITGQACVKVNPGKLKLCFLNLIINGLEAATESPMIQIVISKEPRRTTIRLINNGTPIAPEIQPQIFEAFFSTKSNGVGLGLAITKSLIGQHGGQVYLERSDGNGTEFVIVLPE